MSNNDTFTFLLIENDKLMRKNATKKWKKI